MSLWGIPFEPPDITYTKEIIVEIHLIKTEHPFIRLTEELWHVPSIVRTPSEFPQRFWGLLSPGKFASPRWTFPNPGDPSTPTFSLSPDWLGRVWKISLNEIRWPTNIDRRINFIYVPCAVQRQNPPKKRRKPKPFPLLLYLGFFLFFRPSDFPPLFFGGVAAAGFPGSGKWEMGKVRRPFGLS